MKVGMECAHCLLERAINQVKLATDDPVLRVDVVTEMLRMLGDKFTKDSVPSHIGTDRDLLVQRMTGNDPYAEIKRLSNSIALSIAPELFSLVDAEVSSEQRFRKAILIAAAANSIEFDVSGREFSLEELRTIISRVEYDLAVDQIEEVYRLCKSASSIAYLMDNAGEIVLDTILIREVKRIGPKVYAVVKGGPVLNDATLADADEIGLQKHVDRVYSTGVPAIGVNPERSSSEFMSLLQSVDLIIAKGMGNYESMTEFTSHVPVAHILRTKCLPVANHVGCSRDKNVVLVRRA